MDLTRIFIKRYLRELLLNNTPAGDRVYFNRPINYELPPNQGEIRIQSLASTSDNQAQSPRIYKRNYVCTIEIAYTADNTDYDKSEEAFETLVAQVENIIESDNYLNNEALAEKSNANGICIEDSFLRSVDFRTEVDGRYPIFVGLIRYEICYNMLAGPLTTNLADLKKIVSEYNPDPGTDSTPPVESITNL